MYLLDTDTVVFFLRGHPGVIRSVEVHASDPKAISAITHGELLYGALKSDRSAENLAKVHRIAEIFPLIEVSRAVMETFASIKVDLEKKGRRIDDFDLILGSNEPEASEPNGWATRVYWGGPFGFRGGSSTLLPGVPGFGVVVDVEADDLDGDGRKDLVVTRVRSDPAAYFQGYYFQVLRQTRRRAFSDESLDRIIGDPATWPGTLETGSPITRIRLADVDGDGSRDIVVDNNALGLGWANDGRGYFTFRSPW